VRCPIKRLNLLGERYSVARGRIKEFGIVDYDRGRIILRPKQSTDQARDTLLHEVIHAIDHTNSLELNEHQVRTMATGLRAVFTANTKFAKWVSE